ncbi:hypothetical protein [Streptacidiphilus rugosus]|uniref:hypothetical protein n=1 Tax=Streptacidiphilus rugosus TaxID=405783 RepID=UPI0005607F7C|nr:hypothetical protein [Streptacidiphilus rugosus]
MTTRRKLATALAAAAAALLVTATPATASSTHTLSDTGVGGCQKPSNNAWGTSGSYAYVYIYDSFTENSLQSLHINTSSMDGDLYECNNGYNRTGGSYSYSNHWQVDGAGITTCSIAVGGTGCSFGGGTVASDTYSHSGSNTTGTVAYNGGGWNIYTKSTGILHTYSHSADVTYSYSSWATEAGSSNQWNF